MILNTGKYIIISDKVDQVDFKVMKINNSVASGGLKEFTDSYTYWKDIFLEDEKGSLQKFNFYILVSLLPMISVFVILAFSFFNPRYENRGVTFAIIAIVLYYIVASNLSKMLLFYSLIAFPLLWLVLTYILYKKRVKRFY